MLLAQVASTSLCADLLQHLGVYKAGNMLGHLLELQQP